MHEPKSVLTAHPQRKTLYKRGATPATRATRIEEMRADAVAINPLEPEDMAWLGDVREVQHPIDLLHPLSVRQERVNSGVDMQPSAPHPERHPYCELNCGVLGTGLQFIGNQRLLRTPGTLMLLGPGMPHYALRRTYPQYTMTVHFLPILLFEMGPERDGARMLARFTVPQRIADRIVQPPPAVMRKIAEIFTQMLGEFEARKMGSEFRLRALLLEALVEIMRWEESIGRTFDSGLGPRNWLHVERILRFIHERYAEPIYVKQIARAVGLSVCRLQAVFRDALGMSCVQYLRAYRISRAAALLCNPEARVTEVALEAGFETLSHFNTSFRELMGMSPTEYIRSLR